MSDAFEEIEDRLTEIQRQVMDSQAGQVVSMDEFFPPTFMQEHTQFESFESFMEGCPRNPRTNEELADVPDRKLDSYVANTTDFQSWQAMQNQAAQEEIISQLII